MEAANTHLNSLSEIPKPTVIISVFTTDIHEHFAFRNLISLHIYLLNISYCQNTVGVLLFSSFFPPHTSELVNTHSAVRCCVSSPCNFIHSGSSKCFTQK